MSRPDWLEQRVSALALLDGICVPFTTTLAETLLRLKQAPTACAIAVTDDKQNLSGIVSAEKLCFAINQFSPHENLKKLELLGHSTIDSNEFISVAVDQFSKNPSQFIAVSDGGRFKGFLSANQLLSYVARQNSTENIAEISAISNQFVSYVAHDLRNPLCVVSAVSGLLAEMNKENDQIRKYTDLIRRASRQALQISEGLVQVERYAYAGKIFSQKVHLQELIQQVSEENCELVSYRGHRLTVEHCDTKTVVLDPYLIKRALLNLIDNACKHTPGKGNIRLSAKCRGTGDQEKIEFAVQDEGRGLPQSTAQKIFEPFIQLETDKKALGFGLGLTIAKRFSEYHGGSIRVETVENVGTSFILSIPLYSE